MVPWKYKILIHIILNMWCKHFIFLMPSCGIIIKVFMTKIMAKKNGPFTVWYIVCLLRAVSYETQKSEWFLAFNPTIQVFRLLLFFFCTYILLPCLLPWTGWHFHLVLKASNYMEVPLFSIQSMQNGLNPVMKFRNILNRYCVVYNYMVRYCLNPLTPATVSCSLQICLKDLHDLVCTLSNKALI